LPKKKLTIHNLKRSNLLKLAVVSVLESIRQDPAKYNHFYSGQDAEYPYIDAYRIMILDESQKLFELITRNLASKIVNEPTLTIPS
jgi:hypothetical protein